MVFFVICISSWAWAISSRAFWIFPNNSSPFMAISSNRSAASWFSSSKRLRLWFCNSVELSSFGSDSIKVSISFAQRDISCANSWAKSSCGGFCTGVCEPFRSKFGNLLGYDVCCIIPIALQKCSACWNATF